MSLRIRILYGLFAISGFCGLIYESVWSHYLKLFLGHAAYAQTVVLIVFIGGLALGSWLAGHFATRIARPLLAYAAAELAVGLCAIFFHGAFVRSTNWAYGHLLPAVCSAQGWCWAQWVFAGLLILPQSVLLGTTFPLMSGGILRLDSRLPGARLALLYFLNSIGAVVGVLSSGFVLIPEVGLPGALFTAGLLNVGLAIGVYFVDKNTRPSAEVRTAQASTRAVTARPPGVALFLGVALLTGLSSFIYEIAWTRSLSLVLGASTHSFELMLASFIFGLALGGLWIRGRIDRAGDVPRFLGVVQVVMGALALLTLPVYSGVFDLMAWMLGAVQRSEGGWVLFNLFSSVICLLVMLPATFMAGMTLPLITLALLGSRLGERSIGHVYAANTLGGIIGVVVAVHFALPQLGLKGALVLGGAIDIALGIYLLFRFAGPQGASRWAWSAGGAACLLGTMLFFHLDPLRLASSVLLTGRATLPSENHVLYHRDGKTATVDVHENSRWKLVAIATNGKVDGAIRKQAGFAELGPTGDEYTMVMLGAMPLAFRPDAQTVAVIGYGTGMSTTTVLGSPLVRRVDTIEIEPSMPEGAHLFRFITSRAYDDPRSHIIIDDAKSYFARSRERYDVIVSEPSNPWVTGVSSLFTQEFYARVVGQIKPGGLFVQWLHAYSFSDPLLASVFRALRESFPRFEVYSSTDGDLVVVASPAGPVPPLRPDVLGMPGVRMMLERIGVKRVEDLAVRRLGDQDLVATLFAPIGSPANSDYFPIVDTHASEARFLNEDVRTLSDVAAAPWPIVAMTSREPVPADYPVTLARGALVERQRNAERAEYVRRYLMGEDSAQLRAGLGEGIRPFTVFKTRFIDCQAHFDAIDWWDVAISVAALESVYLPAAASGQVWDRVQKSSCYGALDERTRSLFDLFRAVGRRDAGGMARLASQLLETAKGEAAVEYLYGAALTGFVAEGNYEDARDVFLRFSGSIPEKRRQLGRFRWLESATARGGARGVPAAGSPMQ